MISGKSGSYRNDNKLQMALFHPFKNAWVVYEVLLQLKTRKQIIGLKNDHMT